MHVHVMVPVALVPDRARCRVQSVLAMRQAGGSTLSDGCRTGPMTLNAMWSVMNRTMMYVMNAMTDRGTGFLADFRPTRSWFPHR